MYIINVYNYMSYKRLTITKNNFINDIEQLIVQLSKKRLISKKKVEKTILY